MTRLASDLRLSHEAASADIAFPRTGANRSTDGLSLNEEPQCQPLTEVARVNNATRNRQTIFRVGSEAPQRYKASAWEL